MKLGEKLVRETLRGSICLGLRKLRGRGTPFSRPLHRQASQGLDPLGALRVNNSGMDGVLMMDSGPGKTSALAEPQQIALQADAGHVRAEARGNCKRKVSMGISLRTSRNN